MNENNSLSNFVSMKHMVEFLNIHDQYYNNEDFRCTFRFNDYIPVEGDRIAIFKLGWSYVKDYLVFEWVPLHSQTDSNIYTVIFNKHVLPKKNFEEIYQICYINGENELHGASSPFQFSNEKPKPIEVLPSLTMEESVYQSLSKQKVSTELQTNQDDEIKKLKDENEMLKAALKVSLIHNNAFKNYDIDIAKLQQITSDLKVALDSQQQEIAMLKSKITESKEEYKKLYLEKYKIEKKYDSLKSKQAKECNSNFDISKLSSIPPFPFSNIN